MRSVLHDTCQEDHNIHMINVWSRQIYEAEPFLHLVLSQITTCQDMDYGVFLYIFHISGSLYKPAEISENLSLSEYC